MSVCEVDDVQEQALAVQTFNISRLRNSVLSLIQVIVALVFFPSPIFAAKPKSCPYPHLFTINRPQLSVLIRCHPSRMPTVNLIVGHPALAAFYFFIFYFNFNLHVFQFQFFLAIQMVSLVLLQP
jgi:hypothetical protein